MIGFGDWSQRQQERFYERKAAEVLPRWNLRESNIRWLGYGSNAVFQVSAAERDYVLRIHPPGRATVPSLRSELVWLREIRRRSELLAPYPLPTASNQLLAAISADELPAAGAELYCVLFEQIDGTSKGAKDLNSEDTFQIGHYLGRLHRDAQFVPSADFERPRLDSEGLFGEISPYTSANESLDVYAGHRDIYAEVADRVRNALAGLKSESGSFGLIHADLLAKNVLFRNDSVAALDFEFCGWGYFLYDLAPLLWQLRGERAPDYVELEEALVAGYNSIRRLARDHRILLEVFIAARQVASCRWLLRNMHNPQVRAQAPTLLQQRATELQDFLYTGILRRQSATL